MTRAAFLSLMVIAALISSAALLFIDRAITGFVQCGSAQSCPWHSGRR